MMKREGFVLFVMIETRKSSVKYLEVGGDGDGNVAPTMKVLMDMHDLHWDDKWDYKHRNKYHYNYLDLKTMKFHPLPRWKKPAPKDVFAKDKNGEFKDKREVVNSDMIFD